MLNANIKRMKLNNQEYKGFGDIEMISIQLSEEQSKTKLALNLIRLQKPGTAEVVWVDERLFWDVF